MNSYGADLGSESGSRLPSYAEMDYDEEFASYMQDGKNLSSYPMGGSSKRAFVPQFDVEAQRGGLGTEIDTTVAGLQDNIHRIGGTTPTSELSYGHVGQDDGKSDDYSSVSQGFGLHVPHFRGEHWYRDWRVWAFMAAFIVIVVVVTVAPIEATK